MFPNCQISTVIIIIVTNWSSASPLSISGDVARVYHQTNICIQKLENGLIELNKIHKVNKIVKTNKLNKYLDQATIIQTLNFINDKKAQPNATTILRHVNTIVKDLHNTIVNLEKTNIRGHSKVDVDARKTVLSLAEKNLILLKTELEESLNIEPEITEENHLTYRINLTDAKLIDTYFFHVTIEILKRCRNSMVKLLTKAIQKL